MGKGKSQAPEEVVRRKPHYEFGGPLGAGVLTFGLPILVYLMAFACNDVSGCPAPSLLHPSTLTLEKFKKDVGWHGISTIFTWEAFFANLGWYLLSLILLVVLPGEEVEGTRLRTGGRLKYKFNAFSSSMVITAVVVAGTALQGADFVVWTFIWDNFIPLLTSNIIVSYALAIFVYVRSFSVRSGNPDNRELALGGATGNLIYDFWIGRELNPRVTLPLLGEIDIKTFMEMRPGMLGWIMFDYAMVARQYKNYGFVSDSMLIIVISQSLYVFDGLFLEPGILTMIDIIVDGFGFMLSFGDLAWLPFIYCLQTRYLAVHPVVLGPYMFVPLCTLAVGYFIFRSTNSEKNRFRMNPNHPKNAQLKYIATKEGSKLLVSGWWGRARHINYMGDWILSWAYCLPTGLAGYVVLNNAAALSTNATQPLTDEPAAPIVVPGEARGWGMIFTYFYMLYFAVLLIHRERRDEEKCRKKYGADWEEYRKRVPYRIIPYVY